MTNARPEPSESFDAWHPGVASGIPPVWRDLETLYRTECVTTSRAEVDADVSLTGLAPEQLTAFRPERLALHELIVRITAEIAVPEGEMEEDFGKHFRQIAHTVLDRHIRPEMARIAAVHADFLRRAEATAGALLERHLAPAPPAGPPPRGSLLSRLLGRRAPEPPARPAEEQDQAAVARFRALAEAADDPEQRALCNSLHKVLGAMLVTRGSLGTDLPLLQRLVCRHAANRYGSRLVGQTIAPLIDAAIEREGLLRAPLRERPVLFSLKGPSAAGKSSIRPMLKQAMADQGLDAAGFVTVSPDIWRRLLLDFDSLGPAIKYAGQFTSREVMVIDAKLDRYIRDRANREKSIPDILVDRFRFDSFDSERVSRVLHQTYASHVDTMFMYFVITPPEETVERGWRRALERGRYKSVEDFLAHSVEAYSGMPGLFFRWMALPRPIYRYVFLDNRVPKGRFPAVVASGDQQCMTVFDPLVLVNIVRYQRTNIYAGRPEDVAAPAADWGVAKNLAFIRQCLKLVPEVRFAGEDGAPFLAARRGVLTVVDADALERQRQDPERAALFDALLAG
ncbi:MAG: hypothetical protein KDG55_08185 [Rhodocyclaceae bacterium]|nr:hypothetical protein [Rhodocyclaceae bacterium]